MRTVRLALLYNFSVQEPHIEAPNFYRACIEQVFPGFEIVTTMVPRLTDSRIRKALCACGAPRSTAQALAAVAWCLRNRSEFDVVIGWQEAATWAAVFTYLLHLKSKVIVISYRLFNEHGPLILVQAKKALWFLASRGCELLVALDSDQARTFERQLRRAPGSTVGLKYGVDNEWYDRQLARIGTFNPDPRPALFCPGSAYRDDDTLLAAVRDLPVDVRVFRLTGTGTRRSSVTDVGKAKLTIEENAPYREYMEACLRAHLTVIAVKNADKPVGLTSLLESMALGRPIIVTDGFSSRNYVDHGRNALVYAQGDAVDLRQKIQKLLNDGALAQQLANEAKRSVAGGLSLSICGQQFALMIRNAAEQREPPSLVA